MRGFGEAAFRAGLSTLQRAPAGCCPRKAASALSPLCILLTAGPRGSHGRPAGGGCLVYSQAGVTSWRLRSSPHGPVISEGVALRTYHQGPQGQTGRPRSLLSQDSFSWATLSHPQGLGKARPQCISCLAVEPSHGAGGLQPFHLHHRAWMRIPGVSPLEGQAAWNWAPAASVKRERCCCFICGRISWPRFWDLGMQ